MTQRKGDADMYNEQVLEGRGNNPSDIENLYK